MPVLPAARGDGPSCRGLRCLHSSCAFGHGAHHEALRSAKVLHNRALEKGQSVVKVVQGTQGLEAGVDSAGFQRLVTVATEALLSGNKRELWDED